MKDHEKVVFFNKQGRILMEILPTKGYGEAPYNGDHISMREVFSIIEEHSRIITRKGRAVFEVAGELFEIW